jgi:hypothetical protein
MHQGMYSDDYTKTIFFEGSDSLASASTQLVLWDEDGAFYLVDQSVVEEYSPHYASHVWVLTKGSDGKTQKAFSGSAAFHDGVFTARIPDIDATQISVLLKKPFANTDEEGLATGPIVRNGRTITISGVGFHHVYEQ